MLVRSATLAVALAAASALTAAPSALAAPAPTFSKPVVVRGASARLVGEPAVAVASTGRLAVAFTDAPARRASMAVVVRRGGLSGRLGRREVLASSGVGPVVGVDRRGTPAVAWSDIAPGGERTLRVRVASGPSGRFGRTQVLSRVQANMTSWTVLDNGGRFVALWWEGVPGTARHAVRYAIAARDGRFGPAATLAEDTGPLTGVSAGRAANGTIVAAWGTPLVLAPPTNQQLAEATLAPGAPALTPGPGQRAVRVDQGAQIGPIEVAQGAGGAALTWSESGALPQLLRTAAPGGGAATTIASSPSTDLGRRFLSGAALALPATGPRSAVWADVQGTGGDTEHTTGGQVLAAVQAPDGTFAAPARLSSPGEIATQPAAGASRSLSAYLWTAGTFPRFGVRYAVRPAAGGAVTPARTLASRAVRAPAIASAGPAVVAAWMERDPRAPRGFEPQTHASIRLSVLRDR